MSFVKFAFNEAKKRLDKTGFLQDENMTCMEIFRAKVDGYSKVYLRFVAQTNRWSVSGFAEKSLGRTKTCFACFVERRAKGLKIS